MEAGIRTIIGTGTAAALTALTLLFKKDLQRGERLVLLDYSGRLSLTAQMFPEAPQPPAGCIWHDLAERRAPVALFQLCQAASLGPVLLACLQRLRAISGRPLADRTLAWAAEAGCVLSKKGQLGLGALVRSLSSAEVRAWFLSTQCDPEQLRELLDMLSWCLDFPAVHAVSEGNNRFEGLLRRSPSQPILWLEMLAEHFERDEHRILATLVETAVEAELRRLLETPSAPLPPLTLVHVYPPEPLLTGPPDWVVASANRVRHVCVAQMWTRTAPSPHLLGWVRASQALYLPGPVGELSASAHDAWLRDEERKVVAGLGPGQLYLRDNAKENGIVLRTVTKAGPCSEVHARRAASRMLRRESPVRQFRQAAKEIWPADPRSLGLYQRLCDGLVLLDAWHKVKQGRKESRGVDGVSIQRFKDREKEELARLAGELREKKYCPKPLRQVGIAKPDGGTRNIGIACVRDRVVQNACLSLIEPLWETDFSRFSFAFRPRRSAHQAITLVASLIASGRSWAVIADIQKCFDSIDQELLFRFLSQKIGDRDLLGLIRQWLTADVINFHEVLPLLGGVPQGCPISPFLANVYLHPLDSHLEHCGVDFVRYADDIILLVRSQQEAERSLDLLGEFLSGSLHLALKPAKTNLVAVTEGFDFLGFTFQGEDIRIRPKKVEAVRQAILLALTTLGRAQDTAALLEAWQKFLALVRGARNYFALADEAGVLAQLRQLDAYVDDTAQLYLPADLRHDRAWQLRERFAAPGGPEATAEGEAGLAKRLGSGYPGEAGQGSTQPPPAWLVKEEGRTRGEDLAVVVQPAVVDNEPDGAVAWADGRAYILRHGCYLGNDGQALVLRHKKQELWRRELSEVSLVFLQGHGMSIAVETQLALARRDIPLVLASPLGDFCSVLSPMTSERAHIRGQQAMRRDEPDMVRAGLHILAAKVANQGALLKYFAKYRKKTNPAQATAMMATAEDIARQAAGIRDLDPAKAEVARVAMGYEGRAAAIYWKRLAELVPAELGFGGRIGRGAKDAVNQCLNYAYAILYGEVWQAVVKAGLDPYFGLMHGSQRDQGSLVFDLIEEFRAPFADRLVLSLLGRNFRPQLNSQSLLTSHSRRVLVAGFLRRWRGRVRWRGLHLPPSAILERQARAIGALVQRQGEYQPFRMKW